QRVGGGLLARRLPPRARGRRRLGQSRMPPAGDARRRLGQRTGADALGVARAGGRRHHQRTAWLPGGARPLAPDRKKERRMRQDPLGNGQQGARRRRGGGLRWWVLILFAGYAAWYWFSNHSTDPYTSETVLIDESIAPQDEKALGLQAFREILAQEPPLDDNAKIARQVSEIAQRLIAKVPEVEDALAAEHGMTSPHIERHFEWDVAVIP